MAEFYLRRLIEQGGPPNVQVSSAGIYALPGNPAPEEAVESAAQIDLDLESHQAKPLTHETVEEADTILVMAPEHAEFLLSHHPEAADKLDFVARYTPGASDDMIPDPLGGTAFDYRSSYTLIAEAVQAFYHQRLSKSAGPKNRRAGKQ